MPREVELWHHSHAPRVGVVDDFLELVLRVELALVPMQERPLRLQLRKALRLQAPRIVLGEVPVEEIELVARHHVDDVLNALRRQIVAHRIQHESAPFETRPVGYTAERHVAPVGKPHDLVESHARPDFAEHAGCRYLRTILADIQHIRLVGDGRRRFGHSAAHNRDV